jgi:Mrp family chromosome partitioning ATPase
MGEPDSTTMAVNESGVHRSIRKRPARKKPALRTAEIATTPDNGVAGESALEIVTPAAEYRVALPAAPSSVSRLPNMRRRTPQPVVSWPQRVATALRHATRAGREEAAYEQSISQYMVALATGTHTIAVIGPKGGVGKSSTALTAGLVLAQVPLARPILV